MRANLNVENFTLSKLQAPVLHSLIAVFLPTRYVETHRKGYPDYDGLPASIIVDRAATSSNQKEPLLFHFSFES